MVVLKAVHLVDLTAVWLVAWMETHWVEQMAGSMVDQMAVLTAESMVD
jgi:hypothetical protein